MIKCPRCQGPMHDALARNALSRKDNKTSVCSPCGTEEAMEQYQGNDPWPTFPEPLL